MIGNYGYSFFYTAAYMHFQIMYSLTANSYFSVTERSYVFTTVAYVSCLYIPYGMQTITISFVVVMLLSSTSNNTVIGLLIPIFCISYMLFALRHLSEIMWLHDNRLYYLHVKVYMVSCKVLWSSIFIAIYHGFLGINDEWWVKIITL